MRPKHKLQAIVATLVALAVLQQGAGIAGATTFLDAGFGTPMGGSSPRSLGMGSTGISLRQGSDALFFNPAVIVPENGKLELDFAAGLTQANEDRLVPLYDTFQSFVTETVVALNRNTYANASGGITWRLPGNTPRDRLLEERQIEQGGRLRSLTVGAGAEAMSHLQVGFSLHRYFGDLSRDV